MRLAALLPRLCLGLCLVLCAGLQGLVGQGAPPAAGTDPALPGYSFEGRASWYGAAFQGRRTSNGETYDKEGLTAAHRSLPFGTLLRVTSRSTGMSVVVRVNDRGPFVGDRVIDLSEAAARLIGLLPEGTGMVRCVVLGPEDEAAFGSPAPQAAPLPALTGRSCRIQIASYRDPANAEATVERLRLSGIAAVIEAAGSLRRVVIPTVAEADSVALVERLKSLGYRSLLITWSAR